jgi:hypothetical protein
VLVGLLELVVRQQDNEEKYMVMQQGLSETAFWHALKNSFYIHVGNQEALLHNFSQEQAHFSLGRVKHPEEQVHPLQAHPPQVQEWEELQELDGYHGDGGDDGDGGGGGGEDGAQVQEKVRCHCHHHHGGSVAR